MYSKNTLQIGKIIFSWKKILLFEVETINVETLVYTQYISNKTTNDSIGSFYEHFIFSVKS